MAKDERRKKWAEQSSPKITGSTVIPITKILLVEPYTHSSVCTSLVEKYVRIKVWPVIDLPVSFFAIYAAVILKR